jgi:ribosomal protein S18 acetylase RimI-like enzyme
VAYFIDAFDLPPDAQLVHLESNPAPNQRRLARLRQTRAHRMKIRSGSPSDAEAIARLIASFQSELTDDPSGAGAEVYLASVSVDAEREYLASARYRYLVAYAGSQLAGFIAIRDGSHLFHLFVERAHQRKGLARRLWEQALRDLGAHKSRGAFTVNSSLLAVPVYRAFGFVPLGSTKSADGISFLPMQRPGSLLCDT